MTFPYATIKADGVGRDCIFLSGWEVDCNIGIYAEEKGVTQRVRISVDAYLANDVRTTVDKMNADHTGEAPSYTDIIDAVNAVTGAGHIELLETLAERVAERCLKDHRLSALRIRIEKLERGPVRGVEIYRARARAS